MKKYYFRKKGSGQTYAYDIFASSLKEAKEKIKNFYGVKTLRNIEIWN